MDSTHLHVQRFIFHEWNQLCDPCNLYTNVAVFVGAVRDNGTYTCCPGLSDSCCSACCFCHISRQIAAWVLTWYGVSVSIVIANRWLFHEWQNVGFPFPVLTTMCHMYLKVAVTRIAYRVQVSPCQFHTNHCRTSASCCHRLACKHTSAAHVVQILSAHSSHCKSLIDNTPIPNWFCDSCEHHYSWIACRHCFCSLLYAACQRMTGIQAATSGRVYHPADGHPHRVRHGRGYSSVEPLLHGLDRGFLHHCQVWLAYVVRRIVCPERHAFYS